MSRVSQLFLGVCFLLLVITWVIPELGLWEVSSAYNTFSIFVTLIVVGIAAIAYANDWADKERRTQVVLGKISDFQKRNFALHSEEIQNLSGKDVSALRVYKVIVLSVAAGIGLIAISIISIMSMDVLLKWTTAGVFVSTMLAFLLAINRRMNTMFERGVKRVIRGVVTNKDTGVDDDNDKSYLWIHVGERKVKVEMALYMLYEIGNVVEFHLYERFGTFILHHEKLEGAGIEADSR
jgi:hypothetical protein